MKAAFQAHETAFRHSSLSLVLRSKGPFLWPATLPQGTGLLALSALPFATLSQLCLTRAYALALWGNAGGYASRDRADCPGLPGEPETKPAQRLAVNNLTHKKARDGGGLF